MASHIFTWSMEGECLVEKPCGLTSEVLKGGVTYQSLLDDPSVFYVFVETDDPFNLSSIELREVPEQSTDSIVLKTFLELLNREGRYYRKLSYVWASFTLRGMFLMT